MTEGKQNKRASWAKRAGVGVALSLIAVLAVSSATAMSFKLGPRHLAASGTSITAKQHEGQRSDGTYTSGNITQYKEGDTINFRFTLSSDDAASGQMQVRFTGDDGDCLFFDNYFALGSVDNVSGTSPTVSVASGPTADSFGTSNGEWVVTLNVSFAGAGQAVVNYTLKLSNQAGDCSGSSQHSRLSPLDGVSQTGQQNVPVPANQIIELPSITVTKLVDRGTGTFVAADAGEYCFTLDSGTCTAIDANGQVTFSAVSDGSHTITESSNLAHPGYTFDSGTGTNCTFNGSTATATVASGTTATNASCTFKNKLTAPPKVTVTKSCPNGAANSGDRFQVQLNASNVGSALACGDSLDVNPTPGQAYSITEAAAGTTDFSNYDSSLSAGCSGTLSFGGTASCTITNTRKAAPKVTVTKSCPSGPAGSGDRFQMKNNGTNVGSALACEGSTDVTVTAGQAYAITEGAAGTTDLSNYTSSSSAGCSGTLAHFGDTATCTITNTLKTAPKVTVTKSCAGGAPANPGDRFQPKNNGTDSGSPLACGDSTDVSVGAGQAYNITEGAAGTTDLANYTTTYGAGCSGTLAHFGDTASCTITNTLKAAPKVTVTKSCPGGPAASGDRFQVKRDGTNVGTALACEGSLDVTVTAGQAYAITEGAAGTTDLSNYTTTLSAGCSGTLAHYGDTATCTITNTLKAAPKVTITKACPNGKANTGDRFQAKRNGTNVGDPLDCDGSTDATVTAGQAYNITEGAAGTTDLANYTTTFSAGCSGTLAHYGDTATCTITNTLKAAPKLTVIKHVVNDNGGTKSAGDFTLTVSGSTPSPASFPGSEAGTPVTLKPGPYAVNEAAVSGYATSKSAGCAGTLMHYGDTATCTVTNDDIAAPPPPTGPPLIDLAITKTDAPDPVSVGALLTYTLTVTNKKGDTANDVVVTDSLPSDVTLVSVAATKGSCSGSAAITCNLGTVAYNELVTITIVVRPSKAGTITNTAVVAGREAEHDPSDNTASASTLVQGPFTPPSVCYVLGVTPRSLTVGKHSTVRVSVREAGKPVGSVQVVLTGKGLTKRARTNKSGIATLPITPSRPGILLIRVPTHATCNRQRIGVVGVFTPPVTG